jgi:hypothetical protein
LIAIRHPATQMPQGPNKDFHPPASPSTPIQKHPPAYGSGVFRSGRTPPPHRPGRFLAIPKPAREVRLPTDAVKVAICTPNQIRRVHPPKPSARRRPTRSQFRRDQGERFSATHPRHSQPPTPLPPTNQTPRRRQSCTQRRPGYSQLPPQRRPPARENPSPPSARLTHRHPSQPYGHPTDKTTEAKPTGRRPWAQPRHPRRPSPRPRLHRPLTPSPCLPVSLSAPLLPFVVNCQLSIVNCLPLNQGLDRHRTAPPRSSPLEKVGR